MAGLTRIDGSGDVPEGSTVAPTLDDPVVGAVSEGVGGRLGSRAGRHPWWTPVRVLLVLTAVIMAVGMWQKGNCYANTWNNGETRYTHMCYSDLPYLYTGRGFAELEWPYTGDPTVRSRYPVMEYPVGISYWAYGTAWVTHLVSGAPDLTARAAQDPGALSGDPQVEREIRGFVIVNALGFAVLALLSTWLLARTHRRRPWDAAAFALSPALLLTGLINWDLIAIVLVAGALWTWSRGRPVATGVLIGLGTATKLFPLFLLGGLLVICARQRRWRDFMNAVTAAVLSWVAFDLPALLTGRDQWDVFWTFNNDRGADLGSLWLVLQQMRGNVGIDVGTINHVSLAFFALWCVGVLIVGLRAPQTPRLAQLGFLLVAGFLIVNKVYSPQYVLWLLPLAVLARPRWRDQLIWQSTEIVYFACVWWYLGGELDSGGGGQPGFYWIAIALRVAGELYLVAVVTRDVLQPWRDPVRAERGDPADLDDPEPQEISTRSNAVVV